MDAENTDKNQIKIWFQYKANDIKLLQLQYKTCKIER